MERAVTNVIGPAAFQFHKTANHIDDIDAAKDLLYGFRCDHGSTKIEKAAVLRNS